MAQIHVLDKNTIDQIAAGEVVERPSSVVKELVENAMDAGAKAITVEIQGGGIDLIRITDNGCGIERSEVKKAFLRHATSKLTNIGDLFTLRTLGFRGEALSSISAIAQVEIVTKTSDSLTGTRYTVNGGDEGELEEVGAPNGTTIIVRNLFYNTPARKKFLKSARTEGSYVADLIEHLAMDNPDVSFHFINNKDDRFHTSGNGDLKELIYRIYGRDVSMALVPIKCEADGIQLEGYLGEPSLNRSNRGFENFFVNGRYIKDRMISLAIEEGYKQYLMQHKFPFCVLHIVMDPDLIDVNVHPSKMEVKFQNQRTLFEFIRINVEQVLKSHEMIPEALRDEQEDLRAAALAAKKEAEEPNKPMIGSFHGEYTESGKQLGANIFMNESTTDSATLSSKSKNLVTFIDDTEEENSSSDSEKTEDTRQSHVEPFEMSRFEKLHKEDVKPVFINDVAKAPVRVADNDASPIWSTHKEQDPVQAKANEKLVHKILGDPVKKPEDYESPIIKKTETTIVEKPVQMELFDSKMLTKENRRQYHIVGQIFDTYWILEFKDKIYLVDQHAAHEKVNFERMMARFKNKTMTSQMVNPPVIMTFSSQEEEMFLSFREYFENLGFQIDEFGGKEYAMRAVPQDLFGCTNAREMFMEILDELTHESGHREPQVIYYKIASMACKASVKGNTRMTMEEMEELIDELLTLDNPYNCPHGRPTIISMSKYEIEKRFKRVIE
ncbi:DNA mismatch repair protein MutL [Butyrivibrio fibrisolvens DSM 3071]|uniref:DNA mismatch repair protein MutL n=1 Tax=Butyrivibrio fibrisolvens DSM 3071 TaxID=1121131 RepID=A0A1M5WMG0_BUTFI|nr:DNA mismatch repair endonuclease MutL [Butyrivibrio fibrisolvens]SHH88706.1 DNA mismatch repair protein MutL [Butyrivibrio fibrisolvens DSM 3071]